MKKFLMLSAIMVMLNGCFSAPTSTKEEKYNAIIPLGIHDIGIFIPTEWEKIPLPKASDNVVLLARSSTQNLVISLEVGSESSSGELICNGVKNGFSPFELISTTEDICHFRGRVSTNTSMREFLQKIVKAPDSDHFLLASCSQETRIGKIRGCAEIINSFGILDKKS